MAEDLRTEVFKAGDIRRALTRIGYEIVEGEKGVGGARHHAFSR